MICSKCGTGRATACTSPKANWHHVMAGSRLARLNELRREDGIEMHCPGCDRSVPIDPKALGRRHGGRLTLADLQPRLRCVSCGGRFRIAAAPPGQVGEIEADRSP
jgi:hypothetical protein